MNNFPDRKAMFSAAQRYCGNFDENWNRAGGVQYRICREAGLLAHHRILEIGCGSLSAGFILMQFVEPMYYCGLDPNKWLIDAAIGNEDVERIAARRAPRFAYNDQFDAAVFGERFDFIFAHSVLSHASRNALRRFLDGCTAVAADQCTIVASFRAGETNHESGWIYPDHSHLAVEDIESEAAARGWVCATRPEYTAMLVQEVPTNIHDWVELRRA